MTVIVQSSFGDFELPPAAMNVPSKLTIDPELQMQKRLVMHGSSAFSIG